MSLNIVIPNRNRDLAIVKRSLDTLAAQLNEHTQVTVVDYGSALAYQLTLQELIKTYKGIDLILCPTQGQLWNKSRCINMVLKTCETTHFMVCDMDMLWNPDFLKIHLNQLPQDHAIYFTVGIMTQQESLLEKPFNDYNIKFKTSEEATGISLFPTAILQSINGFDEFYHGWGSEDTDVHLRLKNAGFDVRFRVSEVYFKHQWHEKNYRSRSSTLPFHPGLERINAQYFLLNKSLGKVKANTSQPWGKKFELKAYTRLERPDKELRITATQAQVNALIQVLRDLEKNQVHYIEIKKDVAAASLKMALKKVLGKKTPVFMSLAEVNERLLEHLISAHRWSPYSYKFDEQRGIIMLTLLTTI